MLRLTALIHTHNDGLRLGRCLETVYPCDEILIVDHGSTDRTTRVGLEYGARVVAGGADFRLQEHVEPGESWLLCLDPQESLSEALAATLFEWKLRTSQPRAFSMSVREETPRGWTEHVAVQPRLVPSDWLRWSGTLPASDAEAQLLEGELLRFAFP